MSIKFNTKSIKHVEGTNVDRILQLIKDKKTIDEKIEQQFDQIRETMNFDHEQMMDIRRYVVEMSENGI
jgi:hypothetical protein